jgi:hypothetical protein
MNTFDPVILVIYLVCISLALYKIVDSFNDEYTVKLDENDLKEQLSTRNLQDAVGISFGFDKRYEYGKNDKLKQFGVNINNKSKTHSLYVDWDHSSITDFMGRSRRVTRLVPGSTLDLSRSQIFSTVGPDTTLKEKISAEDVLKRKEGKDKDTPVALEIEVDKPLFDFEALNKGKDPDKKRFARFKKARETLNFSLNLALRVISPAHPLSSDRTQVRCKFILTKLPWYAGLPWNPKD